MKECDSTPSSQLFNQIHVGKKVLSTALAPEPKFIKSLSFGRFYHFTSINVKDRVIRGISSAHLEAFLILSPFISNNIAATHTANWNNHFGLVIYLIQRSDGNQILGGVMATAAKPASI